MQKRVEVMCRHTTKNQVIPMVVTITGKDKRTRNYNVKDCRVIKPLGRASLPNGQKYPQYLILYQCRISGWGIEKIVALIYNAQYMSWYLKM